MSLRFLLALAAIAAPFALYWLYLRLQRQSQARDPWPLAILWIAGVVLAVEFMALSALTEPESGEGRYVPAHLEGDRIIPERMIPPGESP